jgi:formate dehydrogenase subunit gamma
MRRAAELIPLKVLPQGAPGLAPEQLRAVQAALDEHRDSAGALLPILHAVQDVLGFVPEAAVPVIAHRLVLRPEAELERVTPQAAVTAAITAVAVPR